MPAKPDSVANTNAAVGFEEVLKAEETHIGKAPDCGFAISGGGIRSASFGLGVMQGLVRHGILEKIDYLSTVSGGGYIGSSLTWFLDRGFPDGSDASTDAANFPFGARYVGDRTGRSERNAILNFIRQHASYLTPGGGLSFISLVGWALRSIVISLLVYFALLAAAMYALRYARVFTEVSISRLFRLNFGSGISPNVALWFAVFMIAVFLVVTLLYSLGTRLIGSRRRYRIAVRAQQAIGLIWTSAVGAAVIGSLPYAAAQLESLYLQLTASGGLTVLGTVAGLFEFRKAQVPGPAKTGGIKGFLAGSRTVLGSAALVYGLLLGAYIVASALPTVVWLVCLILVVLVFGLVVNLNYVGLHRMYRDRLMETFLPDAKSVKEDRWGMATDADGALLEDMGIEARRPYHLINTNVVLINSPTSKYRGRGGDNFILSPRYCGSNATGYRPTADYMKRGTRGMTLATAMAISGAAMNPHTGVAGKGAMRNKVVAALMSLLNLRLGYWAPNPQVEKPRPFPPNFIVPGFMRGVLGVGFREGSRSVELSDGGHFENLGLYELIRRRLRVIIVSDAGADPAFRFGDLENAVERIRVDFGVKVEFRKGQDLDGLLPGSAEGPLAEKYNLAKRGFAVGDIVYPDGGTGDDERPGTLLYIKSTLTPDLPPDIYGYKSANEDFPDQTTADQFFDEEQFEAYRELGYQLAKQLLTSDELAKVF